MNKLLFFVIFYSIILKVNAQIWVKPNAIWHYEFSSTNTGGIIKIQHIGDTVINSKNAMMLQSTKYEFAYDVNNILFLLNNSIIDTNYTWQSGDTVFYWQNNNFEVLFNFSNSSGDSWVIGTDGDGLNGCSEISTVKIVNQGVFSAGGLDYQSFDLFSDDTCDIKLRGSFNSRFGCHSVSNEQYNYLFPSKSFCSNPGLDDTYLYKFRCFQDDELFYKPGSEDCDYPMDVVETFDLKNFKNNIFPNPTNGLINIYTEDEYSDILIYNSTGELVEKHALIGDVNQIEVSLKKGVYFVYFIINQSTKFVNRLVII
jgi:hypothetical protein